MKKRIVSILLASFCFFSGACVASADTESWVPPPPSVFSDADWSPERVEYMATQDSQNSPTWVSPSTPPSSSANNSQTGSYNMLSTDFTFNPSKLSPSSNPERYNQGTSKNISNLLATIGRYLLIATTTIAVLSITVGGLMIATTGPSDRAAKGKTIITLNIMGVVIALFSYSIIRFVSWIIAA